jgi:hypothetical protein
MKECKICQVEKPISDFYKCPTATDGYYGRCKRCMSDVESKKHRDQIKEKHAYDNLPGECWLPIKGYEGIYEISNHGRLKRLAGKKRSGLFHCKEASIPERILRCGNAGGYPVAYLTKDGKGTSFLVHRLVAIHFIVNPESKPYINHIDNNRGNPHYSNLEWCTPLENALHAKSIGVLKGNGGIAKGKPAYNRKLNKEQVFDILSYEKGTEQNMFTYFKNKYDISKSTVSNIRGCIRYRDYYDLFQSGIAIKEGDNQKNVQHDNTGK